MKTFKSFFFCLLMSATVAAGASAREISFDMRIIKGTMTGTKSVDDRLKDVADKLLSIPFADTFELLERIVLQSRDDGTPAQFSSGQGYSGSLSATAMEDGRYELSITLVDPEEREKKVKYVVKPDVPAIVVPTMTPGATVIITVSVGGAE